MEAITFEQLPTAFTHLFNKVENIERLLQQTPQNQPEPDRWFDIDELCDYLPGRPAKATIYGKVHCREIPHKKLGKRLAFLKSEIDEWLKAQKRKTFQEIQAEASDYVNQKKRGLK